MRLLNLIRSPYAGLHKKSIFPNLSAADFTYSRSAPALGKSLILAILVSNPDSILIHSLGPREKKVLGYFNKNFQIRTKDLSLIFKIKERTARDLLRKWITTGFIKRQGGGKRDAYYVLSEDYRKIIGG